MLFSILPRASLYLYRLLRRERMMPLDEEEMQGLRQTRGSKSRLRMARSV